jgi:hypothetical protein
MRAASAEVNQLLRRLRQAGWQLSRTGRDHWVATSPDGRVLTLASTPNKSGFVRDRAKVAQALAEGQVW